jgi:hypothetical protein
MVTFTNSGRKDVYISGPTKTFFAGARIPFGAMVMRQGTLGRIQAVILENEDSTLGIACSDEKEHTYDGFYEIGEPVQVALKGARAYANIIATASTSLVAGDYLDVADHTSGTAATGTGCLEESGAGCNVGETRVITTSVAQVLEDVTLTSAIYAAPSAAPTPGTSTIAMTSGGPTNMGLQVGDMILIADANGTDAQVNAVTAITDTQLTVQIPITTADSDLIYAIRQAEVIII